jgi:hypothetical protein
MGPDSGVAPTTETDRLDTTGAMGPDPTVPGEGGPSEGSQSASPSRNRAARSGHAPVVPKKKARVNFADDPPSDEEEPLEQWVLEASLECKKRHPNWMTPLSAQVLRSCQQMQTSPPPHCQANQATHPTEDRRIFGVTELLQTDARTQMDDGQQQHSSRRRRGLLFFLKKALNSLLFTVGPSCPNA